MASFEDLQFWEDELGHNYHILYGNALFLEMEV